MEQLKECTRIFLLNKYQTIKHSFLWVKVIFRAPFAGLKWQSDSDRMEGHQMFRQTLKLEKHINLFFLPVRDSESHLVKKGGGGQRYTAVSQHARLEKLKPEF